MWPVVRGVVPFPVDVDGPASCPVLIVLYFLLSASLVVGWVAEMLLVGRNCNPTAMV